MGSPIQHLPVIVAATMVVVAGVVLRAGTGHSDFTTLAAGENSGVGKVASATREERAIRSGEEWTEFWGEHASNVGPRPPLPFVNFDDEEVLAVVLRNAGPGDRVKIVAVEGATAESIVQVRVTRYRPRRNELMPAVLINPYHFIKVRRSELPVRFVWSPTSE